MENAKEDDLPFQLTAHARRTITARGISPSWIACVLAKPIALMEDKEDPTLRHALGRIPERGDKILRVIYNETVQPWCVVTAFIDRKASREL